MQPRPSEAACKALVRRLGSMHVRQRLGLEADHAAEVLGRGRTRLHPEDWIPAHRLARAVIRACGIEAIGRRNARRHRIRRRDVFLPRLPEAAAGLRLLHLSDLHLDMAPDTGTALVRSLANVTADACVITGDFRAKTYGPIEAAVEAFQNLRPRLPDRVFAVLGNHDCLALAVALERMNVRVLLNESVPLHGGGIYLAGVDDPHYYRMDNLHKALEGIPPEAPVILLSHSPEIYRQAAHADVDLFLCGHTHGGQICLPGGRALTYDCRCPVRYCRGAWQHGDMQGYTSRGCGTTVLDVRFFCPPEIVLHRLLPGPPPTDG